MKRCPKCNRTFTTDTQKFCTHDGGLLLDAGQETVRIEHDAPTKVISRDLISQVTGEIDPFKTIVTRPEETGGASQRATHDLSPETVPPPAPPQPAGPPAVGSSDSVTPPPTPAAPPAPQSASRPLSSGPIAAPAPPLQALPRKKSNLPLVLGLLAVLFIVGVVAIVAAVFVVRPRLIAGRIIAQPTPSLRPIDDQPTPLVSVTPSNYMPAATPEGPPEYTPPPNAVQFVNSKDNLEGKLAEHYADFSFYYPDNWEKDPKAGVPGATNFVKVERRLPPEFTQENLAVGWYSSSGSLASDRAVFHTLAENLSAQFEKNFPEYHKVSEGETKAGFYEGYEFRFEAISRNTAKGDLRIWGRTIFLPPSAGQESGVVLLMLTTSLAPELKSVDDVGVKGELPMILESFRFGKK